MTARHHAWAELGIAVGATTAKDAMDHADLLGWDVRKVPLTALVGSHAVKVPGRAAVVRGSGRKAQVIGDVGEKYSVVQNEDTAELLDALVAECGATFTSAGAIEGGKRVFTAMRLPGQVRVGGQDAVENYIVAAHSHDSSMAFRLMVCPVHVASETLLTAPWRGQSHIYTVPHGRGRALADEAQRALDFTFDYLEQFQVQANQLASQPMTQAQFERAILRHFGPKAKAAPATVTRTENKLLEMARLFGDRPFTDAWSGFTSVAEWFDHHSPVRGADHDTTRALNAAFDTKFKAAALAAMLKETKS